MAFASLENDLDSLELWGIEIKSRQSVATVNAEKENNRILRRKKYEEINCEDVHKYVQKVSERFQLLHHAYVYGLKKVALVVGTKAGKILSGTLVNYSNNLLGGYGNVAKKLKEDALSWAYTNEESKNIIIPDDVIAIAKTIPAVNGKEALYGTLKLWKQMYANLSILPWPTLKRIIPRAHAKWNANKGGSDSITKIVDDCFVSPPKAHTNYESVAVACCFSNLIVALLRIYQITSSKKDIRKKYKSIYHFRDAASKQCTFKKALRHMHRYFKEEIKESENNDEQGNVLCEIQQQSVRVRVQPNCNRFRCGTIPEEMSLFAPQQTFKTPTKARKKQVEKGNVAPAIEH